MARRRGQEHPTVSYKIGATLIGVTVVAVLLPAVPAGFRHFWEHFRGTSTGIPGTLVVDGNYGASKPHRPGADPGEGPCRGTFTADDGEEYSAVYARIPDECEPGRVYDHAHLVPRNPSGWVNDDRDEAQVEGGGGWGNKLIALLIGAGLILVGGFAAAVFGGSLYRDLRTWRARRGRGRNRRPRSRPLSR